MLTDLDEALERLQQSDFECGDGTASQGPAAVVALEALGHPALIPFFTDVYGPRLRPLAEGSAIPEDARARALGERGRRADWLATFEAERTGAGHEAVLARWLPVLLPGAFAASGNGPVRTVAALRARGSGGGPARRRELAFGLAHWASRYQVLPGQPGARPEPGLSPAAALGRVPPAASDRRRIGPLSDAVLVLEGDAGFAAVVASIDPAARPAADAILELAAGVAALQLAHPESRGAYGQATKTVMAMHALVDVAPASLHAELVGRAAQIAFAVHAVEAAGGTAPPAVDDERDALAQDVAELRYRAACSGDANAITLAEACLRAHALHPDPVLLRAAADAALRFGAGHGGRGG